MGVEYLYGPHAVPLGDGTRARNQDDDWMPPGTPSERYVTALRLLAGQCEALADQITLGHDTYPYYPQGNLALLARTHAAALQAEALKGD